MKKSNNNSNNTLITIIIIILICISVVSLILFYINGETTITRGPDTNEITERLTCYSNTVPYSMFKYDYSRGKNLTINATFSNDSIHSISLIYKLEYSNADDIYRSESENHATMNLSMQGEKLSPDAFNATYNKLKDGLQLSLYATSDEITEKALKYFMLDKIDGAPYSAEKVAKIYNQQGLNCELKVQEND